MADTFMLTLLVVATIVLFYALPAAMVTLVISKLNKDEQDKNNDKSI